MKFRKRTALTLGLLFTLPFGIACSKGQTPTEAFKLFYEAAKKKDPAGLKKTISKRMLTELENEAKREGKPFDEFLVDVDVPATLPEVRDEKIEGDTATLEVKGRADNWRKTKFIKEDGVWKLDSD